MGSRQEGHQVVERRQALALVRMGSLPRGAPPEGAAQSPGASGGQC